MAHPRSKEEFAKFAGQWTNAEMHLDLPDETKLILGREDLVSFIFRACIVCGGITFFTDRDLPILAIATPICSTCYLASLKDTK